MPVLTKLAKGEDKENWSVDWEGYMGLDNATTEEIEQQKRKFKDGLQSKAIQLLRHLSTEEALSVLRSVGINTEEDRIDRYHRTAPIDVSEPAEARESPEIPEATVYSEAESLAKTDSVRMRDAEKEMIEEDIEFHAPFLPQNRAHLEENYRSPRQFGFVLEHLARARDLQSVVILTKVLLSNPRAINRAGAADAIGRIEAFHYDHSAMSALIQALDDSTTDVQFNAARALVSMGDTLHCVKALARLARGEYKERWTVDWDGYMGLDSMSEDMIVEQKAQFRDGLQRQSIQLLRRVATAEALSVLSDLTADHRYRAADEGEIGQAMRRPVEVQKPAPREQK